MITCTVSTVFIKGERFEIVDANKNANPPYVLVRRFNSAYPFWVSRSAVEDVKQEPDKTEAAK